MGGAHGGLGNGAAVEIRCKLPLISGAKLWIIKAFHVVAHGQHHLIRDQSAFQ